MLSLIHSSSIFYSYECVIVAQTIGKLTGYTKDAYNDKQLSFKDLLKK